MKLCLENTGQQDRQQASLSAFHEPGNLLHNSGGSSLLSPHFTGEETEAQGRALTGQGHTLLSAVASISARHPLEGSAGPP